MKPIAKMTAGELAAYVATHLGARGIPVVLSGGTCVTIYSEGRYVSADLDLVGNGITSRKRLREALADIGFTEKGRQFFHPETPLFLDCPRGPVAIGQEPPGEIRTLEFATGRLPLLSPTDCVKDRLAAYYHWNDEQSLEQATLVAQRHPVDLKEIREWSRREGHLKKFDEIRGQLEPHLT